MSIKKILTSSILGAYLALSPMSAQAEIVYTPEPITPTVSSGPTSHQFGDCDYNGNAGVCLEANFADPLGLENPVANKCLAQARPVQCYDKIAYETVLTSVAESKDATAQAGLTDLELFHSGIESHRCTEDFAELNELTTNYNDAVTAYNEASAALNGFVTSYEAPEAVEGAAERQTLDLLADIREGRELEQASYSGLPAELQTLLDAEKEAKEKVETTKVAFEESKLYIQEHGCGYVAPPPKKTVDVTPTLRGVVDTDGNFGGEIELDITYPLTDAWNLGAYVNGSLLNHASDNGYENDLGLTTEEISESTDLRRYMGAGALVGYDLTDWFALQGKIGAAWMHEKGSKDITRFGETQTLTSAEHKCAGEASLGVQFKPYKGLTIDVEARGNTNPGLDAIIGLGYKF